MPESHPTNPGPMPSLILVEPLAPPAMTSQEAIAIVKRKFGYPPDMPDSIWRTEYGGYQHLRRRPGEPRTIEPWVTDVWKVTATGERLVDYFIPGRNRDSTPPSDYVMAILIDDKERTIMAHRGWRLADEPRVAGGGVNGVPDRPVIDLSGFVAFLEERAAADAFSGAVAIARDGSPIFERSYGLASKAFNAPNHVDTKFNLGSMNKMFTAVAIAQLVEQGKLSFEDTIGAHLASYPDHVASRVTIHHLLTHTSGLGGFWNEAFDAKRVKLRTVQDFLSLFIDDPLHFEPGERFAYSNAGFVVLGAIVEAVSGQSYFDYVREYIYLPAGMRDTDAYETDQDVPNLAVGYTRMSRDGPLAGPRRNNLHLHVVKGGPAGGGYSTVGDLLRFAAASRSNRLLSPDMTELVLRGKVEMDRRPGARYGYGFVDRTLNGVRIVGHWGGFPGIGASLDIYLDLGYDAAILSNYDPDDHTPIAEKLGHVLTAG